MREILEFEKFVNARYNHRHLKAKEKAIIDKQIQEFLDLEEYHKNLRKNRFDVVQGKVVQ